MAYKKDKQTFELETSRDDLADFLAKNKDVAPVDFPKFARCMTEIISAAKSRPTHPRLRQGRMSVLMIRCPATGQAISTGIETDQNNLNKIPNVLARTRCPMCRLEHVWWKREAWLADGTIGQIWPKGQSEGNE
jgi:hypothetical protein